MAEVASAYVSLLPSARGFASGLQRQTGPAADKAGRDAGKRFGGSFTSTIKTVLTGVAAFKALDFFGDAVRGASDLEQSIGGVRAVFGKYADDVERDSKRAADSLGLSRNAYNELITVSAAMLKNKGLKNFAGQSRDLIRTGADLAAQFGGSTRDAVDALNAAMRGESDPIERYGISLNETAIKAELSAKGQDKLTGAALEQAKAVARLALIQKQSADAQGANAREADTFAGRQARLTANFEDMRTELGQQLLPTLTDGLNVLSDFVEGMQDGTGAGGQFVDVLGDARDVGEGVLDFFEAIPGPVKKYGAELAIAAVVLSKLNSGLLAGRSRMTGWIDSLGPADAQMTRVNKASYALGAGLRNLAGAGGMLALIDGAKKSDSAVGTLETTLGGAAAGFAVGGPVGAAVGGLGGLVFSLGKNLNSTREEVEVSVPSFKEYGTTLDGVAASTTRATREMVFQRLEQSGLLTATRELGLTDRQVVQAMMGNEAQRKRLSDALRNQNTLTDDQERALRAETGALGTSRLAQLQKNVALARNAEELRTARRALRDFMAEPSSKRVAITGVEDVRAQLKSLRQAIRSVWGKGVDLNTSGPGGIDVLLPHGATGGIVTRPTLALIGEAGPEAVVPLNRTPGSSPLSGGAQFEFSGDIYAQDVNDFLRQIQTRARHAGIGGVPG